MAGSRLINRNVTASRGRTSMRLEPELWEALEEICQRESVTLADLVKRIEHAGHPGGRTSAVRVHVLGYFRNAAHMAARADQPTNGHGGEETQASRRGGAGGWHDGGPTRDSGAI
jgi:predicted DNA-binding ribbon-helix-helix protein